MGEIADGIINGDFDSITGDYLGEGSGYPRTAQRDSGVHHFEEPRNPEKYDKSTHEIRKELAILIKEKHKSCETQAERNKAVNDARYEINKKYGKGWREQI